MESTGAEASSVLKPTIRQALDRTTSEIVEVAKAYTIDSNEMATLAGEELVRIKREYKRVEEMRLDITRPLDAAKKAAMAAFKPYLDKLDDADRTLRGAIGTWMQAEQRRVAREEAAAREAEAARLAKIEADRQAAEAMFDKAVAEGDAEAADKALEMAEEVREQEEMQAIAPLQDVAAAQKLSGVSGRKHYRVQSVDLQALVKAASTDPSLLDFLQPNTVEIGKLVRARGMKHGIPGVEAVENNLISVRT